MYDGNGHKQACNFGQQVLAFRTSDCVLSRSFLIGIDVYSRLFRVWFGFCRAATPGYAW